jgi:hypothetical protein
MARNDMQAAELANPIFTTHPTQQKIERVVLLPREEHNHDCKNTRTHEADHSRYLTGRGGRMRPIEYTHLRSGYAYIAIYSFTYGTSGSDLILHRGNL